MTANKCTYVSRGNGSSFDVTVPISDGETGVIGKATLHCTVSPECHTVKMSEWQDTKGRSIHPSGNLEQRIEATLCFVADHRVCGNHSICPSEVVRIGEENSSS